MKKLLLIIEAICAAELAFGQGRIGFNNASTFNSSDAITIAPWNQGSSGGLAGQGIGGDKYSVQLVWVAGAGLNQAQFDAGVQHFSVACTGVGSGGSATAAFFAPTGPVATGAGFFDAGAIPSPVGTGMPVGGYTAQVSFWYNVGFSTYQAADAAGKNVGKSALFNITATVSPTPANNTFFPGFQNMLPAPEPSTPSLMMIGLLMMVWFRRKK